MFQSNPLSLESHYITRSDQRYDWQDLDQLDTTLRMQMLAAIKDFLQDHSAAVMDHDPDWLFTKCSHDKSVKILFSLADDGTVVAYAPFFVHPTALSFELLGVSLWEYRIRRYSITAGPLFANGVNTDEMLSTLFDYVWKLLGNREALYVLGMEPDSLFGQFVRQNADLRKKYQLVFSGKPYYRRLITLPSNFDQYIQYLGYGTRKEIRRVLRRLEQDSEITIDYRIFTTPEDIAEFLPLAQQVSDKTYQRNLLGLGIRDNAETRRILTIAAGNGWFQSYLLVCNQQPVAFQLGYVYDGTYYAEHTGYDPAWGDKSIGTVVQIYRIRDLITNKRITQLDFLYGDNERKRSLSNKYRIEQNIYLVPRRFPLEAFAFTLRVFNKISELGGDFIEKWGVKSKIRRYLRKRSVNRN